MASLHTPNQNFLLAALPTKEFSILAEHLELVPMLLGECLYEPGTQLRHAYFPTTAIVSLQNEMASGATAQTAGVGNEGMVGISLFMGGDTTSSSAVVQTIGHAYRLDRIVLLKEFKCGGILQSLLLRYTQGLMTQIAQTAVCNRHHSAEQQLCRWLLLTLHRQPSNELVITQELVARMLGVRRETITEAAGKLQCAGHIDCRRGHITVLDRSGLEALSCECYGVVKLELSRLMHDVQYRQVRCDKALWRAKKKEPHASLPTGKMPSRGTDKLTLQWGRNPRQSPSISPPHFPKTPPMLPIVR